jgi:hypothetical protein
VTAALAVVVLMSIERLAVGKRQETKLFSESEGIMGIPRFLASVISGLFGLSCLTWSILAVSSPTQQRGGATLIGVLLFLLAFVYTRVLLPRERKAFRLFELMRPLE